MLVVSMGQVEDREVSYKTIGFQVYRVRKPSGRTLYIGQSSNPIDRVQRGHMAECHAQTSKLGAAYLSQKPQSRSWRAEFLTISEAQQEVNVILSVVKPATALLASLSDDAKLMWIERILIWHEQPLYNTAFR